MAGVDFRKREGLNKSVVELNNKIKQMKSYMPPKAELIDLIKGMSLLSSMSIYGDVYDYEEGGVYDGRETTSTGF